MNEEEGKMTVFGDIDIDGEMVNILFNLFKTSMNHSYKLGHCTIYQGKI